MKGSTETPLNELNQVRLPASLRTIGDYAFFNKPMLKEVEIPSLNVKLGTDAFDEDVWLLVGH